VKRGRIQCYGLCSNTLSAADPEISISLEILFHIAKGISPNNHFKGIDFLA
jgi:hypothetical protein